MTKICILTPAPDFPERWQADADRLSALLGDGVDFRCWMDAGDLTPYRLVLPLMAWGYQRHTVQWFRALDVWEKQRVAFANAISLVRWNTDKGYLPDLEMAGIPIVPTRIVPCLHSDDVAEARAAFATDMLVIKPAISGGADGTYRLGPDDAVPFDVLERDMLIQPLMATIAEVGEFSLFYFAGQFSHAILKRPAKGDFRVQEQYGGQEGPVAPPAPGIVLAEAVLGVLPVQPLYARVDMVQDSAGVMLLMELEIIEPSLFLHHAGDGGAAFKAAVAQWVPEPVVPHPMMRGR